MLCDYNNVPVVKLMGDVLDGIFAFVISPGHDTKIFLVEPDVDFGQAIHFELADKYLGL